MKAASEQLSVLAGQTTDPGRLAKVRQLVDLPRDYKAVASRFKAFKGQNDALNTAEGKAVFASALKFGDDISSLGQSLSRDYHTASQKVATEAEADADLAIELVACVGLASILIGLVLAYFITRSIKQPIVDLTGAMSHLAKGDLTAAVPYTEAPNEIGAMARSVLVFKDSGIERRRLEKEGRGQSRRERGGARSFGGRAGQDGRRTGTLVQRLGDGLKSLAGGDLTTRLDDSFSQTYVQIRNDFNEAVDKLKGTILAVVSSTGAIHGGAKEIPTASDDLSRRTEQQAASLEETAAALDEITATVRKSA